jgi:hypothetical protein
MNKGILFILIVLLFGPRASAQLSVSIQEPPAGIVQKSQLWNITMIYAGTAPINVIVSLSLFDIKSNQPLMTATTRAILLNKGVKLLNSKEVMPVDYNFIAPAFENIRLTDAFLPIGNYRACYTFYENKTKEIILAEECINLEIQPLSPPQLNLPSDSAIVETAYPQFNWLPPAPVTLFSNLNYDLLVAEVQTGQSAETAIQDNIPVYTALHLTTPVNNFPASYKSLDTGRIYAWRIIAKNGDMFAAQSEVWTFKVNQKKPVALVPANGMYLDLSTDNTNTSTGIIPDNILGLKYYSYERVHTVSVIIKNTSGRVLKTISTSLQYGNNFIVVKLDPSFSKDNSYLVEIADLQNTVHRAFFRIAQ